MTRSPFARFLASPRAVTAALLLLGLVPALTGLFSVAIATGLIEPEPEMAQYARHPLPILAHILAGSAMMLIGPFQVNPRLRIRRRRLHKAMGRVFVLSALVAGLAALWMNQAFPAFGGWSKWSSNALFGAGLVVLPLLALRAILAGDVPAHRAWMIRTYALALGPATQRVILLPLLPVIGLPGDPWLGLFLWACWLLNLGVAEWAIRRGRARAAPVAGLPA